MSAILPFALLFALGIGLIRKTPISDAFRDGVREGILCCVRIFPTLLLLLISIGILRASGALGASVGIFSPFCERIGVPAEILPLALIRPLSGSGGLAVCDSLLSEFGADSPIGMTASVLCASNETTFYAVGVYLSGAKNCRVGKFLFCALICDIATVILSVYVCRLFG